MPFSQIFFHNSESFNFFHMNQFINMVKLFLLLHFIFLIDHVKPQNLSDNSQDGNSFQPSLAVVIGFLSIMFALTFLLLLYAKFCHRASSVHNMSHQIQDGLFRTRSRASGIDKTVIESLPFFRFSSLKGLREGLECAVCLARFEDVEILRLLPKCKHAFHINCIDQWLEKHSTCPLCRQKVSADDLSSLQFSNSFRFLWNQSVDLREESNLELYVQREENCHGSSRFSIGSSFRISDKGKKEEELPIQQSMDSDEIDKQLHKLNHKIVISDVVLKNRWSNVSSSDLMFLNSELLNDVSSARFSSSDSRNVEKSNMEIKGVEEDDEMTNIKKEMERKRLFESKLKEIKQIDHSFFPFPRISTTSDSNKNLELGSKVVNSIDKRSMSEIIVHPRFTESKNNRDPFLDQTNVKDERIRRLWIPIARKTVQWFANRETRPPNSQGLNQTPNV